MSNPEPILTTAVSASGRRLFFLGIPPRARLDRKAIEDAGFAVMKDRPRPGEPAPDLPVHWDWWVSSSMYGAAVFYRYATPETRRVLTPVATAIELSRAKDSIDDYPCPPGEAYLPFQRAGIQYAMMHRHVLIADEMGLGKTVQAIGVANAMGAKSILVICPASIRTQWVSQLRRWLVDGKSKFIYAVMTGNDKGYKTADIVVISYDLMRNKEAREWLSKRSFDLVILDEAHYLKNHGAERTKAVLGGWAGSKTGLISRAKKVVALTGTPLPNRPRELYTLLRALNWDLIDRMTYPHFVHVYNPDVRVRNLIVGQTTKRLAELQMRLRAGFMIRRTKAEVATELPAKTYEVIELDKTGAIKKALVAESMLSIDPLKVSRLSIEQQSQVNRVRREMGIAKVPSVVAHIEMLLEGGAEKLVVFAWHREVIALICQGLQAKGYMSVALTGQTPAAQRMKLVDAFCTNPDLRVFVAQLQAGGAGIDGLQRVANIAVFAECSWVFGDNEQAADRLHRGGQALPVTVQFLVAPGSLDAKVLTAALLKCKVANAALDKRG